MLIDSNVLVAAIVVHHLHHEPSAALLQDPRGLAIAGHSYAETFVQLTRRGPSAPAQLQPHEAWAAMQALARGTRTVGLTPMQTLQSVARYAEAGGIGARLYDHLIGQAAVTAGIRRIVTWNVGHMRSLFPDLDVLDPTQAIALGAR